MEHQLLLLQLVNRIKAIIFDYDGVIAESVNVKTEAFAEMYKPYGESILKKVVSHHEANGGISRFEKFRIYHNLCKLKNYFIIFKIESITYC